ncbi:MAG: DnaJ domain-containing protein [Clostridia bacterium]|nr:DnaJ domain-containing protein [Clostridia bacterium]
MPGPFEVLGLPCGADAQQIRAAYRQRVKACHPDQFQDEETQRRAQEELVRLNLAYEEALRLTGQKKVGFNLISQEEAKHFAIKLMAQGNLESALRQLNRAETKDDSWYYLQGQILMSMRQYETAHQSYREAVRRDPNNQRYRQGALDAALAMKRNKDLPHKFAGWVKDKLNKR